MWWLIVPVAGLLGWWLLMRLADWVISQAVETPESISVAEWGDGGRRRFGTD
jgi:hypothetical protein